MISASSILFFKKSKNGNENITKIIEMCFKLL